MKLILVTLVVMTWQLTTYEGLPTNTIETLLAKTDKIALEKLKCLAAKNKGQNIDCKQRNPKIKPDYNQKKQLNKLDKLNNMRMKTYGKLVSLL